MENLIKLRPYVAKDGSVGMLKTADGSGAYVRFSDVEEKINSLQQLKAEIAAIADLIEKGYAGYKDEYFCHRPTIIGKLRQLSAI